MENNYLKTVEAWLNGNFDEQTKEEISASNEETDGGEREGPDVSEEKEEE